jgi:S-adenosylmethionine:tRNA ribosyltransferase-isomerase
MKTADFDYDLPQELIAQTPIEPRDSSRLLVVDRCARSIAHRLFTDITEYLGPGDLLVFNESRVIPARIYGRKPTGGQVEILLLRPRDQHVWEALCRGKRIRPGAQLQILRERGGLPSGASAEVVRTGERGWKLLAFDRPVLSLADEVGATPLPPYIHAPLQDADRYQTVYARTPGSAAAPTAGLHFTPGLLERIREMGVGSAFVTLHIGLDTFRPVTEERVEDHQIHTEYCVLTSEGARRVNATWRSGGRIVAVGTTSLRVLESAARGVEPGMSGGIVRPLDGPTDLFVYPGHTFRAVDALITNFHLPRSTLLMLVAAFAEKALVDRAYAEAIRKRYRFYSFGDAMIIL